MKKLLVATTNPGKLAEICRYLSSLPLELVSLAGLNIQDKVKETGDTFKENAILKTMFFMKLSGLPTIGDDGGFEIDALGGEPGVKSHRWIHGDREDTDEELIRYTFKIMKDVPEGKRGAQLRAVLAFAYPGGPISTASAVTRGIIPFKPSQRRSHGFPYRSILFLPEIDKFYNEYELTPEENKQYNHRKKALKQLKPIILKSLDIHETD